MSIQSLLIHKVDIQVETVTAGGAGGMIRSWGDGSTVGAYVAQDVDARVQPFYGNMMYALTQTLDKQAQRINWSVTFYEDRSMTEKHRILYTDTAGVQHTLLVRQVINAQEMDHHWVCGCEELRDVDDL